MQSSSCHKTIIVIYVLVLFSLLFSPIFCLKAFREKNRTSMMGNKLKTMKLINAHLRKINKPFLKSIKSPDGDIIDCVLFHLQPAFDRLELRGKMSVIPPELPKGGHNVAGKYPEIKQLWNSNGESCPNGTIPIRRTTASDILRSGSISKFGKKYSSKDTFVPSYEDALGYTDAGDFYGAKAIFNIWEPNINTTGNDFSASQLWVTYDIPDGPVNGVEAGWQVSTYQNLDTLPRLFTYWTADGYSGCYNMLCPGFVQISQKYSLGVALHPIPTYNGQQYDIAIMIWKDPRSGDWWLKVGSELMGYWPKTLFTDLQDHATLIKYGGEVFSGNIGKNHTSTQMGSGHFPNEGFGKAALVRNLEVIDQDNTLNAVPILYLLADRPHCYGVKKGYVDDWGDYIFFGGPGYNPNCP